MLLQIVDTTYQATRGHDPEDNDVDILRGWLHVPGHVTSQEGGWVGPSAGLDVWMLSY
jgi:hypothetical protein